MANVATAQASLFGQVGGANPVGFAISSNYSMAGSNAPLLQQTVTTTPTLLGRGNAATIGKLLISTLAGSFTTSGGTLQTVTLSTDNPQTKILSAIDELDVALLCKPLASPYTDIYVAVNTGTVQVQYQIVER